MFTNAKTVMIGEKEVQSIVTSDGGIIYKKSKQFDLVSDKYTLTSSQSALLTATLTEDGEGIAGELVNFYGVISSTGTQVSVSSYTDVPVGIKYAFVSIPNDATRKIYLNRERTVYLRKDAVDGIHIIGNGWGSGDNCSNVSVENGIITYTQNGTTYTKDFSDTDMSVIYSEFSGVTITDYGVYDTTDANGEAQISYTPTSTGDIKITAYCMDLQDTIHLIVS